MQVRDVHVELARLVDCALGDVYFVAVAGDRRLVRWRLRRDRSQRRLALRTEKYQRADRRS